MLGIPTGHRPDCILTASYFVQKRIEKIGILRHRAPNSLEVSCNMSTIVEGESYITQDIF